MTSIEMPKYKCHKQVWALKIREVAQGAAPAEHTGGSWLLVPEDDRYAAIEVAHDWYARHKPEAGGYYVVYGDGYSSYSPAEAFESGYHPVDVGCSSFVGSSDQSIEQEIQAKGLTAPRITPADIEANIAVEHYFTAGQALAALRHPVSDSLNLLTFCVLVLRNGFTVTGESACASPENFDADTGRKIARQNAIDKVWPLMGFELCSRLHEQALYRVEEDPKPALSSGQIEKLLAGPAVVGADLAEEPDQCVRFFLEKGAVVKVEGIPLELYHDAVVLTHPANVPLIFPPRTARPAESGE